MIKFVGNQFFHIMEKIYLEASKVDTMYYLIKELLLITICYLIKEPLLIQLLLITLVPWGFHSHTISRVKCKNRWLKTTLTNIVDTDKSAHSMWNFCETGTLTKTALMSDKFCKRNANQAIHQAQLLGQHFKGHKQSFSQSREQVPGFNVTIFSTEFRYWKSIHL